MGKSKREPGRLPQHAWDAINAALAAVRDLPEADGNSDGYDPALIARTFERLAVQAKAKMVAWEQMPSASWMADERARYAQERAAIAAERAALTAEPPAA